MRAAPFVSPVASAAAAPRPARERRRWVGLVALALGLALFALNGVGRVFPPDYRVTARGGAIPGRGEPTAPLSAVEALPHREPAPVDAALGARGYGESTIRGYVEAVQSSADTVRVAVGSALGPRLAPFERVADGLLWLLPALLTLAGLALLALRRLGQRAIRGGHGRA